jgi:hypothetical protein
MIHCVEHAATHRWLYHKDSGFLDGGWLLLACFPFNERSCPWSTFVLLGLVREYLVGRVPLSSRHENKENCKRYNVRLLKHRLSIMCGRKEAQLKHRNKVICQARTKRGKHDPPPTFTCSLYSQPKTPALLVSSKYHHPQNGSQRQRPNRQPRTSRLRL